MCYPHTRGKCPKMADERAHDICLYDEAEKFMKNKGFCSKFLEYGKCRDQEEGRRCIFLL